MKINCGLKSPTALRKVDSEGTEAVSMRELRTIFFATPGPHLRSDYALTAMRAGCRASHWKRGGDYNKSLCILFRPYQHSVGQGLLATTFCRNIVPAEQNA